MNNEQLPMDKILDSLEDEVDNQDIAALKEEIRQIGLDPEKILSDANTLVTSILRENRLAWKQSATAKKEAFQKTASRQASWKSKSKEEIEEAFLELEKRISNKTEELVLAYRNKGKLTTEDKIRILDAQSLLDNSSEKED